MYNVDVLLTVLYYCDRRRKWRGINFYTILEKQRTISPEMAS